MLSDKKIEEVRKQIKKTIEEQKVFIEDEPEYSGDPHNTVEKYPEETEAENEKRNSRKK